MRKSSIVKLIYVLFFIIIVLAFIPKLSWNVGQVQTANGIMRKYSHWFSRDFSNEQYLMALIRESLANNTELDKIPKLNIDFDPSYSYVAVSLFQEGNKPLRWISKRESLLKTLNRIIFKLRARKGFSDFDISSPTWCRIMLEVVTSERPLGIDSLSASQLGDNRFEPGITGFKLRYNDRNYFYMPTDAAINSHLSTRHVLNFISKKIGISRQTNKISERIKITKQLPIDWSIIKSVAFITYGEDIIPLYRGYPIPVEFSRRKIFAMAKESVDWAHDNMSEDGRFLYYYDGVKDSVIDHMHPNRTRQRNYYNILRHSGGILTLLKMYELTEDEKYVVAADKAIGYLVRQVREHRFGNKKAYYIYFNNKAKLGGTGVALVALLRYYQITGDTKYGDYISGMVQHILSRITEDGEMIGYYIHPSFNEGNPIMSPSPDEKKQLFSFYYPGEALLGLALFEREMELAPKHRRQVRRSIEKAMDFLIKIRPMRYADLFRSLPSDGWLMQAIEELSYDAEFQREEWLDFVFDDAKQMISHMYTEQNAPYYDYPGTFYYNYGDHGYLDGARAEGLISAYYLAKRVGREELAEYILANCKTVAKSLMHGYNSKESTFMHKFPEKSIGSFRFKFTRQWVRIDMVQHTACFFARLFSSMEVEEQMVVQKNR